MKLEINTNHKKIDLKNIKNRNMVAAKIMSSIVAITFLSGFTNEASAKEIVTDNKTQIEELIDENEIHSKMEELIDDGVIKVPQPLRSSIAKGKNTIITEEYLESLTELNISTVSISDKEDLLWLNYCTNLETLKIMVFDDEILEYVTELPNLKRLAIFNCGKNSSTLDSTNSKLLFSPSLEYLVINQFNVQKGLLESLKQLKILDISNNNDIVLSNYDIDYSELTNLNTLIVNNPYTLAIHMDSNEINDLINSNVNIVNPNMQNYSNTIIDIDNKIDEIVSSLEVTKDSSNEEKIDAIIMYVINKLTYDPNISEQIKDSNISNNDVKNFYNEGCLYGALELDTAICGNYAALISTLCDRLDLPEIAQMSTVHAWNLIFVDGEYYYVDATLIDGSVINENDLEEIKKSKWYLRNPLDVNDYNHDASNLSDLISIEPITIGSKLDISDNQYILTFNNKSYILKTGALVGILAGLGLAYKKKEYDLTQINEEKIKRM